MNLRRFSRSVAFLFAVFLIGCTAKPQQKSVNNPSAGEADSPPHGDGRAIEGVVVSIDTEHKRLMTNIPSKWMMADLDDKNPLIGTKQSQAEGVYFKLFIGDKSYPAKFACWRGAFRDASWIVDGGYFPGLDEAAEKARIYLEVMKGDAAKVSGASVGTIVRLVKKSQGDFNDQ
jgi:hypothetical protein